MPAVLPANTAIFVSGCSRTQSFVSPQPSELISVDHEAPPGRSLAGPASADRLYSTDHATQTSYNHPATRVVSAQPDSVSAGVASPTLSLTRTATRAVPSRLLRAGNMDRKLDRKFNEAMARRDLEEVRPANTLLCGNHPVRPAGAAEHWRCGCEGVPRRSACARPLLSGCDADVGHPLDKPALLIMRAALRNTGRPSAITARPLKAALSSFLAPSATMIQRHVVPTLTLSGLMTDPGPDANPDLC